MYGFGEPSGQTPDLSLGPTGNEFAVGVDHFGWGFGDPRPEDAFDPAWAGDEIDWGFGDPEQLLSEHIQILTPREMPDDGGEIVLLVSAWPEIGPYQIKCVQSFTGQNFPEPTAPLPFCSSPIPGDGADVYTDIKEEIVAGVLQPLPGPNLKFVLPILPPGIYDIELLPPGAPTPIILPFALEVIWRNRSVEQYAIRQRHPSIYSVGQRIARYEVLLGYDSESETEIT